MVLGCLFLAVLPVVGQAGGANSPAAAAVTGTVTLAGKPPEAKVWDLDPAMQTATGQKTWTENRWLVSKDSRLANCVVLLKAKNPQDRKPPQPIRKAVYQKIGAAYEPRVMVIPVGTEVTFRNKDSPCQGFMIQGRTDSANYMIPAGKEEKYTFKRAGPARMMCPLRVYMTGMIYVADTPYCAVTDRDGNFHIAGVPPGEYLVTVWHEEIGKLPKDAGPQSLTVESGKGQSLTYTARAPALPATR